MFLYDLSHYKKHVKEVLKVFFKASLYAKLSKCLFNVRHISFPGFILTDNGIEMDEDQISTILNWSEPESVREI